MKTQRCEYCGGPLEKCETCDELFCTCCETGWAMDENVVFACPVCVMDEYQDIMDSETKREFNED